MGQRLVSRLSDRSHGLRFYEIDMRLRPSGRQGLLVSPLPGFARYHARRLPVWERLSLLRLRPVAEIVVARDGDPDRSTEPARLGSAVVEIVRRSLLDPEGGSLAEIGRAVVDLKQRIEVELARENRGPAADRPAHGPDERNGLSGYVNVKTGVGGCLELELLTSALELAHAPAHPNLLVRGVVDGIERLGEHGILAPAEVRALCAAYRFERLLLNRLRMTHHGGIDDPDRFAQNSPRLTTLARRMGLPSRQNLLDQYQQASEVVRGAFERHIGNAARSYGHGPGSND
jgi:glutamate-ammonia-ligase adenylyltransferase